MRVEAALPSVLVIDDDEPFAKTLARALSRRGWAPQIALSAAEARAAAAAAAAAPAAAVVDLRISEDDGLALLEPLRAAHPGMRIFVLTGYASIRTLQRKLAKRPTRD